MDVRSIKEIVSINCHSSICIGGDIYIDPYNIKEDLHNARIIFLTHSHYDHCDLNSIENIINDKTVVIASRDTLDNVKELINDHNRLIAVLPNDSGEVDKVKYTTFPSYNIDKPFHPKKNNWVGYQLTIDNIVYTICGDTDLTEELRNLKTDVLLIPIGGKYTMNWKEASNAVNIIKPKIAIPTHYDCLIGNKTDAKNFSKAVGSDIQVIELI